MLIQGLNVGSLTILRGGVNKYSEKWITNHNLLPSSVLMNIYVTFLKPIYTCTHSSPIQMTYLCILKFVTHLHLCNYLGN